jgi:hypothetical protein
MSALLAAQRGQAAAERNMLDACTVQHQTGESTDASGTVITPTYGAAFYTGKCQVQTTTETGQAADVGQAYRIVTRRTVKLPMSVTGVVEGDRIVITAAALDAALVGNVYVARDIEEKTFLTARRVTVLEVTS